MAKQLNVSLAFTADTSKAKQQIQELQQSLTQLLNTANQSSNSLGLSKEIQQANAEVAQLKLALQQATSATGTLDLGQFTTALQKGGLTVSSLQKTLTSLGPAGTKAFQQLATSVMNADVPLKKTSALLQNFKTTLINTARWQLSSSMLHGFMGAVQSAYRYTQDLNESLNNIRIVTGQSSEQMAQFAINANQAAKRLSTTTTSYTDASLIYYQQGLDDKEVQERTEATIKMANVSRQSAENVSSQMTAIWNNFDDGSKSLEYYGDVITALGAKTAASSQEIAQGLEKFAAVSKTVGLSYEYATAALATVVAQTRQSADTVGTAFRTIFSRLEGLKLGETLEDGVDLNKYSAALKTVGVDILDATGNLKDMDTILEETASHWDNLTQAQKVAFAETVGGVRQYTNLIALFDNWDKMKINLDTAQNAEGTLNSQADIYAESWEAASKRVKASAESIYSALLNDKFFIQFNNGFAQFLGIIENTIKGLGGVKGVLLTLGSIITTVYKDSLAKGIDNFVYNLKLATKTGKEAALKTREEFNKALMNNSVDRSTASGQAQFESFSTQGQLQSILIEKGSALTEQEQQLAQVWLQQNEALHERAVIAAQNYETAQKTSQQQINSLNQELAVRKSVEKSIDEQIKKDSSLKNKSDAEKKTYKNTETKARMADAKQLLNSYKQQATAMEKLKTASSQLNDNFQKYGKTTGVLKLTTNEFKEIQQAVNSITPEMEKLLPADLQQKIQKFRADLEAGTATGQQLKEIFNGITAKTDEFDSEGVQNLLNALEKLGISGTAAQQVIQHIISTLQAEAGAAADAGEANAAAANGFEQLKGQMQGLASAGPTLGAAITGLGSSLMSVGMIISSVKGLKDLWESDASAGEKLISTITTVGMVILTASRVFSGQNQALAANILMSMGVSKAKMVEAGAHTANTGAIVAEEAAAWPLLVIMVALTAAIVALAAIIYAVVQAFKAMEAASPEGRMKALREEANRLQENLEDIKSAADEVYQAFMNYDDIYEKYQNATKGTQEWLEYQRQLNEAVTELINKYPDIKFHRDENGTLVLDEGESKKYQDRARTTVGAASERARQGQENVKREEAVQSKEEAAKSLADIVQEYVNDEIHNKNSTAYKRHDAGEYAKAMQQLADVPEDVIRQWIETGNGQLLTDAVKDVAKEDFKKAWKGMGYSDDAIEKMFEENGNWYQTQYESEEFLTNLTALFNNSELQGALETFTQSFIASSEKITEAGTQTFEAFAATNADRFKEKAGEGEQRIAYNAYKRNIEKITNELLDPNNPNGFLAEGSGATTTTNSKQLWARYLESVGKTDLQYIAQENQIQYGQSAGERKYAYKVAGDDEVKYLSAQEMAESIAAYEALRDFNNSNIEAANIINSLQSTVGSEKFGVLSSWLGNRNFNNATLTELSKFTNEDTAENIFGLTGKTAEEQNEIAQKYGFDTAQELITSFNLGLKSARSGFEELGLNNLFKSAGLDDTAISRFTDHLTLTTATDLKNKIHELNLGPMGEQAGNNFITGISTILAKTDPDKQETVLNKIMNTDWTKKDAVQKLKKDLQELGIEVDKLGIDWDAFDASMKQGLRVLPEFEQLKETLAEISGLVDKLDFGTVIKEEDYQRLIEFNKEWEKFFILTSTGERRFIGNKQDMEKATIGQITNMRDEIITAQNASETLLKSKWTNKDGNTFDWTTGKFDNGGELNHEGRITTLLNLFGTSYGKTILGSYGYDEEKIKNLTEEGAVKAMEAIANYINRDFSQEYNDTNEMIASTATTFKGLKALKIGTGENEISAEAYDKQHNYLLNKGLSEVSTYKELQAFLQEAKDTSRTGELEISKEQYSAALINIAENYDNCTEEIKAYNEALKTEDPVLIEAAEKNLTTAIAIGELAKNADLAEKDVAEYTKYLKTLPQFTNESTEQTAEFAVGVLRLKRGLASLASDGKKWLKNLNEYPAAADESKDAVKGLSKALSDITGLDASVFDRDWLLNPDNQKLVEDALTGEKEAVQALQASLGEQKLSEALKGDLGDFKSTYDAFVANELPNLEIGAEINDTAFYKGLTAMVNAGKLTTSQLTDILSSVGMDVETEEITMPSTATENLTTGGTFVYQPDPTVPPQTVTVAGAINNNGDGTSTFTIIKGAKYKGAGGGGGSSGGGGGGGKKKHIEKKQPEEAKDRYHVVKNQLEEQQSQYKRIDTAYQRAYGKSKLDLLDKQIAKQKELIKVQQQYLDEAKEYLKYDKQQLELEARKQVYNEETNEYTTVDTSVAGLGMSIEWNDTGGIDNIDAIMQANLDRYNAEIDRINKAIDSGEMTQEEADWAQKVAEAQYQGLLDTIGQYEETQDFVNEKLQDLIDAQNQYYDQLLEKTKLRVQLRVEVDEDSLNLINFLLERLEADAYKAAQRIDKLGESFAASADKMDAYKWGLIDLLANHGDENAEGTFAKLMAGEITPEQLLQQMQEGGNVFTQAEADAIREYMQNIMSEATEQLEIQKKVIEEIGTVLEENNRRLDRQIGKIEHLQNVMSSYKNIIDLSGRQFLGITSEIYDAMEEANVKLANDTLEADKARMDASNAWLQKIKEDYAAVYDTLTDEAKKAYEEQIEAAEDAAQEATEAYYSSWEAAIEAINTRFESAMQHMAEDFSKTMAGVAGNLEGVQQRMDLRKMVADVYVPEYEKMYQLTKLTREAQKSIDNASNVKVKQELLRVQQKIVEAQESGAKISQYELDYLQRELDLKAAQMALEEASKAKSQVRMTRDSEGNYAYVYTANEEAVEEAEQNYADKLYEMQKLNEEYVASLQDMLVELESNYIQALQDAAEMYGQGTEEYASAVADIQSQYGTYFDELMSEMGLVLSNNKETETIHAEIYKRLTGDVYQANVDLQTSWEETTLAGVTGYETLGQYQTAWAAASQKAYDDVIQANDIWMASMAEAYNLAGESIDTFAQTVGGDFEQIKEESQSLKEQMVEEDLPAMTEAINEVSKSVKSWQETYAEAIKAMLEDTEKMIAKYNELLAAWSKVDQKHQAAEQQGNANDANSSTGTQTNGNNSNNNNGNTKSSSSGSGGSSGSTGNQGGYGGGSGTSALIGGNNAIRNLTMLRFASGGYTGDWAGDEGKIAVLDRKELVLNAQDTFNILKAVDMIKSISQTIDINAMSAGGAFSNLISPFVSGTGDRLEQEVHITAEFPNVTNKNEILEAFDNVINLASQYANR